MYYSRTQSKKGFVILFSVLISAIVLMITVGIFRISSKQTMLASSAREAHRALAVADAAIECALYLEIENGPIYIANPLSPSSCQGAIITPVIGTSNGNRSIRIGYEYPREDTCAYLMINDTVQTYADYIVTSTKIQARGFNICDEEQPLFGDPLLVERVYEVSYRRTPITAPGTGGGVGAGGN